MSCLKYIMKIEKNICFNNNQTFKFDKFNIIYECLSCPLAQPYNSTYNQMFIIIYVTLTISLYLHVILFTVIIMVRPLYIKAKPVQRQVMLINKAKPMLLKKDKKNQKKK